MWRRTADCWCQRDRSAVSALAEANDELDELHTTLIAELASGQMALPVTTEMREGSLHRLPADRGHRMYPDDYSPDLYTGSARGRPTVPARVMATVMPLQPFEGLNRYITAK
jgi:hypothetical protein